MIAQERQKIRHLLVIKDRRGKRAIPLTMDLYSLGRSDDNLIVLYGSSVSRQHATIIRVPDSDQLSPFKIIDGNLNGLKSSNGILINGHKCQSHKLQHGDFIEFGNAVKVTYYTLFNLLDQEFAQFCDLENSSEVIKQSILSSQAVNSSTIKITDVDRQTLIRLASFPELTLHPIIEINLTGSITYFNPIAIKQFPQLVKLNQAHPIISGLPSLIEQQAANSLKREIKFNNKFFEQSIQYLAEDQLIRILMTEITERQEETTIKEYSDLLFKEVIVVPNLSFQNKIQSLLKIGCSFFNLDLGFLGKLQQKSLLITTIYQDTEPNRFIKQDQILKISETSEDRSLRLFQATINNSQPVTLQNFENQDSNQLLPWNHSLTTKSIPITSYLGIKLVVAKKPYGILVFCSPKHKIDGFSSAKIDFLKLMAQWVEREIERKKMELILKKLLKQKKSCQQIAAEIRHPIQEVKEIAQQLLERNLDSPQHFLAENLNNSSENLLSLINNLLDTSS